MKPVTPLQREDGMGEMTEYMAKEIVLNCPVHKKREDCINRPCIRSQSFLRGLEQGRKESGELVEAADKMEEIISKVSWFNTMSEFEVDAVLKKYRQHRTGKGG
jgi:hypothetical protein